MRSRFYVSYKSYHFKHYKYWQHPILWVVLNITTKYKVVLGTKLNRSAVETAYKEGWIDCTFQDILGQKF